MKNLSSILVLATLTLTIFGCSGRICPPLIDSDLVCIGFKSEPVKLNTSNNKQTESASGFNPRLGTEVVVSQKFEQKFSCDSKAKPTETKTFKHHGYPELKLNPRRNIPIQRSTFTNLINNQTASSGMVFSSNDSYKYFRVFVEPRDNSDVLGRYFGAPLLAVERGENRVQYKYESCQKYEPSKDDPKSKSCVQWFTEEEGEIVVAIGLTEKTENPEICRRYPTCVLGAAISYSGCNPHPSDSN